ncbi:MAG: pbuE, partial [Collimonas fungivorans]|uniref:MFS transporter n=1 Tax=Collimonas fungivorans TaxID=158899 RepID=UPI0026F0DAC3
SMDRRIYLLALVAFIAGLDENIVGGILPLIARDLSVSVSVAGQLTSVFSLSFALCAALLLSLTARFERRTLLQTALAVFALSNLAAALAPNYAALFVLRIVSAASCSLIVVLSTTFASALVAPSHRGRAIGVIFMGISGSLVLGIPFGIVLSDHLGWRLPFAAMALLAAALIFWLQASLPRMTAQQPLPLSRYWQQLAIPSLTCAQLVSILMIAGHFTLFAYLAPYLGATLGLHGNSLSLMYALFGASAVSGGYLGGWLSDRLGARRTLWLVPAMFTVVLASLPLFAGSLWLFLPAMMIWSSLSWSISPTVQSYLIGSAPADSEVNIGLNTSAMHLGVALGAACGGMVIAWQSLSATPWFGAALSAAALLCACVSLYLSRDRAPLSGAASQQLVE